MESEIKLRRSEKKNILNEGKNHESVIKNEKNAKKNLNIIRFQTNSILI